MPQITIPDTKMEQQFNQYKVRILTKGLAPDVQPQNLAKSLKSIGAWNVAVSPDGSAILAPAGGRTVVHKCHELGIGQVRNFLDVVKLSPEPFGASNGSILAVFDEDRKCIDLRHFVPPEKYSRVEPIPEERVPTINITHPNGAETFKVLESIAIAWNYAGELGSEYGKLNIYLMKGKDAAYTWYQTIATGLDTSDKGYDWAIEDTSIATGDDYKIRLQSPVNAWWADDSDGYFTIQGLWVQVTTPNGGESLVKGVGWKIEWDYASKLAETTVKLELYDVTTGAVVHTITESLPITDRIAYCDSSAYGDLTTAHTYKIKITNNEYPEITDMSDAPFSVVSPTVVVTAPSPGSSYKQGTVCPVAWYGAGSTVNLVLYTSGGALVGDIAEGEPQPSSGSFNWTVDVASGSYYIKVVPTNGDPAGQSGLFNVTVTDVDVAITSVYIERGRGPNGQIYAGVDPFRVNWSYQGPAEWWQAHPLVELTTRYGTILATRPYTDLTYAWIPCPESWASGQRCPTGGNSNSMRVRPKDKPTAFDSGSRVVCLPPVSVRAPVSGSLLEPDEEITIGGTCGHPGAEINVWLEGCGEIATAVADENGVWAYEGWKVPKQFSVPLRQRIIATNMENDVEGYTEISIRETSPAIALSVPLRANFGEPIDIVWSYENVIGNVMLLYREGSAKAPREWTRLGPIAVSERFYSDSTRHPVGEVQYAAYDEANLLPFAESPWVRITAASQSHFLFYTIWDRQATGPNERPHQQIWRVDLADGPSAEPAALVQDATSYPEIGTAYPTVRDLIVGFDGQLYALWMDADGSAPDEKDRPGVRDGDTVRLIKYDPETGSELWTSDIANAIRVFESEADTIEIKEHAVLAATPTGELCVAAGGFTVTDGTYEKYIWVVRVNGGDGSVDEVASIVARHADVAIDGNHDVGLCQVFGAAWSPEGHFWILGDYKFRDLGTEPYEPSEFSGHVWRLVQKDFTVVEEFAPKARDADWTVPVRISYHPHGCLIMAIFYLYDEGGDNEEERIGLMCLSLNGEVLNILDCGYDASSGGDWPHTGGKCGIERTSNVLDVFALTHQWTAPLGGLVRSPTSWLTDGKNLWSFDIDSLGIWPRMVNVGGEMGQGGDHDFNCHALARTIKGDLVWLSFEYQSLDEGETDMRVRISVANLSNGQVRYGITQGYVSSDKVNRPFLPQPYTWTESEGEDAQKFPWMNIAVRSPRIRVD